MATATATLTHRRSNRRRWLVIGSGLIVLAVIAAVLTSRAQGSSGTGTVETTTVTRGTIIESVAGSGSVAAAQTLDLSFQTSGTVAEVLVKEGDTVEAGQVLAKLDTTDLALQVRAAEAALSIAQANLATTQAGPNPNDVATAQAQLDAAKKSAPTAAEIAAARANLESAKQNLVSVQNEADPVTQAKQALDQAKNNLWAAQTNRDGIAAQVKSGHAAGYQLDSANAAVANAEIAVQQAQQTYDAAVANPTNTALAQAQAQVKSAEASLASLLNSTYAETVAQAEAAYNKAVAGPTAQELAVAEANVETAQINLEQAQRNLGNATLKALSAGVVTAVNIVAGGSANSSTAAVTLMDRSTLHVDLKLNENDVVNVQAGQPVTLTIDSLDSRQVQGTVSYIAPAAETTNGVVTYAVRVSFPDNDPQVKVGMTANVDITTAKKANVLLVPNTALLSSGNGHAVQIASPDGTSVREVEVQVGLSDGSQTEIVSGLNEGDRIVALPSASTTSGTGTTTTSGTSTSTTPRTSSGLLGGLFGGPGGPPPGNNP